MISRDGIDGIGRNLVLTFTATTAAAATTDASAPDENTAETPLHDHRPRPGLIAVNRYSVSVETFRDLFRDLHLRHIIHNLVSSSSQQKHQHQQEGQWQ